MPRELMTALSRWVKYGDQTHDKTHDIHITKGIASPPLKLPAELPGFTVKYLLAMVGENHVPVIQLLRQFAEMNANAAAELNQFIVDGKPEAAAAFLHRLRGATGTLGALGLTAAANSLEREITDRQPLASLELFVSELTQVLASIAALPRDAQPTVPEFDCEKCRWKEAPFQHLRMLLENYHFIPHELIDDLKDKIKCQAVHNDLNLLARKITQCDYAEALTILNSIRCAMGHKLIP
jgi:HPt (histidine-containing phosphotransfer) domain-containing protein